MRWPGFIPWGPLGIAVAAGGLAVVGAAYFATHYSIAPVAQDTGPTASGPLAALPQLGPGRRAAPDSQPAPKPQATAASNAQGIAPGQAGNTNPEAGLMRAAGAVTAISQDPATFTVRTEAGLAQIWHVLDLTVFRAGFDRPYNFGLLRVGDLVNVRGGLPGQRPGLAAATRQGTAGGAAGVARGGGSAMDLTQLNDGQPIARMVEVRPADEVGRGARGAAARGFGNGPVQ